MKKIILFVLLILFIIFATWIVYLNVNDYKRRQIEEEKRQEHIAQIAKETADMFNDCEVDSDCMATQFIPCPVNPCGGREAINKKFAKEYRDEQVKRYPIFFYQCALSEKPCNNPPVPLCKNKKCVLSVRK
ncbi:hypothetical protein Dip510_001540 [Elusimicrobium posterum]|uniref:hypothetical protein n=1 Tax=Elusimicrobium posterum TaxID=3116653 RepID=UPI003C724AAF